MTTQFSPKTVPVKTSRVDALRLAANLSGLSGALLLLLTAGSSDAGALTLSDLVVRMTLGISLVLLWRALSFFAEELERARNK